jgi:hypothetical protein
MMCTVYSVHPCYSSNFDLSPDTLYTHEHKSVEDKRSKIMCLGSLIFPIMELCSDWSQGEK